MLKQKLKAEFGSGFCLKVCFNGIDSHLLCGVLPLAGDYRSATSEHRR